MRRVAILIPVYNGLRYTQKCLKDLALQLSSVQEDDVSFSIIVIDDGSKDNTAVWVQENHPEVILVKGNGNLWWSGGINLGAKYAIDKLNVDFVLLWNNDITTTDEYFNILSRNISNRSIRENEIIGSKIYSDYKLKRIWSLGGVFDSKTGKEYMLGQSKLEDTIDMKDISPDWLPGMGTLVPAKIINDIGYWDEKNFPQYFGDSEFTLRAKCKGYRIRLIEDLKIINDISNSTIRHQNSFSGLIRTLHDRKSLFNIKYHLRFYRKFATSPLAYISLIRGYFRYIGGFLKWKILGLLDITKK